MTIFKILTKLIANLGQIKNWRVSFVVEYACKKQVSHDTTLIVSSADIKILFCNYSSKETATNSILLTIIKTRVKMNV